MAEYIEREEVERVIEGLAGGFDYIECGWKFAVKKIKEVPAADVVPVRHGRWLNYDDTERFTANCSLCGSCIDTRFSMNYCPNCGARMDLVTDCNRVRDGDGE